MNQDKLHNSEIEKIKLKYANLKKQKIFSRDNFCQQLEILGKDKEEKDIYISQLKDELTLTKNQYEVDIILTNQRRLNIFKE